jgi:hypothetical protein
MTATREALLRGCLLSLCYVIAVIAFAGSSPFGFLLAILLGLLACLTAVPEQRSRARGPLARLGAALFAGAIAANGLVLAVLEVSYTHATWSHPAARAGLGGVAAGLTGVLVYGAEVGLMQVVFAAPFALATLGRLFRLSLPAQVAVGLVGSGTLALLLPGVVGFVGFPQPSWLHRLEWFPSGMATFFVVQPLLTALALPAISEVAARTAGQAAPRAGA